MLVPFSENAILVMGPECPGKFATFVLSLRSQIFIIESSVPVPKNKTIGMKLGTSEWLFCLMVWYFCQHTSRTQIWESPILKHKFFNFFLLRTRSSNVCTKWIILYTTELRSCSECSLLFLWEDSWILLLALSTTTMTGISYTVGSWAEQVISSSMQADSTDRSFVCPDNMSTALWLNSPHTDCLIWRSTEHQFLQP